jgi:hypothetical protein
MSRGYKSKDMIRPPKIVDEKRAADEAELLKGSMGALHIWDEGPKVMMDEFEFDDKGNMIKKK